MKPPLISTACGVVFALCCAGCGPKNTDSTSVATGATSNAVSSVFERFTKEKYALAETIAKKHEAEIPPRVRDFFVAAEKQDWTTTSNLFSEIEEGSGRRNTNHTWLPLEFWGPVHDTIGAYEIIHDMNPKFVNMFGDEIVKSIPPGSIYFGGTDHGRFLVSAFSDSHSEGRPFFTLTQNALADPTYLRYVADMYGDKIKVADTNDSQNSYSNYTADVQARIFHDKEHPNEPHQIKPGEDVSLDSSGHTQVNGQVAIMGINALMTKAIFDKNPIREFFVEESYPLDWMFPHLTPFGMIMKINRSDIPELSGDILKRDHEFWTKYSERLVGNWITYDTPVKDVTTFAERVYLNNDYSGFHGDLEFVHDESAQKAFSKLRSSIAGLYTWRIGQSPSGGTIRPQYIATGANRAMVEREADFAFKQSFAFCPYSPDAIYRYVQLLVNSRRIGDALLIAETGQKIDPDDKQLGYLISTLKFIKSQSDRMPGKAK